MSEESQESFYNNIVLIGTETQTSKIHLNILINKLKKRPSTESLLTNFVI